MPEHWWRKNIFSRLEAYSNLIHVRSALSFKIQVFRKSSKGSRTFGFESTF